MKTATNDRQDLTVTTLTLWLNVQGHSKFVAHNEKRVRQNIEQQYLSDYGLRNQDLGGDDYLLAFTHSSPDDLKAQAVQLFDSMSAEAEMYDCFIETDIENAQELGL